MRPPRQVLVTATRRVETRLLSVSALEEAFRWTIGLGLPRPTAPSQAFP